MHRRPDRVVIDRKIVVNCADNYIAGVQADANGDVGFSCRAHRALHLERRVDRAHRVILVGERRSEQRHDPVALHFIDRALVAMDGIDHHFQRRPQTPLGLLGI